MAKEKNIMEKIAQANQSVTKGIDPKDIKHWAKIYIMGKVYEVPADLTIMQAMEYAGYRFIHSCGCRAGFCGACSTIYRMKGEYKLRTAMACQTRVEDGMYLVQLPFSPAEKPTYSVTKEPYEGNSFLKYFPEIARCVSCNTCTKACPQDLEVMDYVQAALRGDFQKVAELSFDCIQCGMCALRCPAEIVQYNVSQFGRVMYGRNGFPENKALKKVVKATEKGEYNKDFKNLLGMNLKQSKEAYKKQQANKAEFLKGGKK